MKVAMLRIGIDTGSGGIHGPFFRDGSFDYVPIPDRFRIDERTYGNTTNLKGKKLVEYFPESRRVAMADHSIHYDPEFVTYTYGDPTPPKAGLRYLEKGDMLIFYCGLQGWDFASGPALYLIGYFEVLMAGRPHDLGYETVYSLFEKNFHVRHKTVFERQKTDLVLVRGSEQSRLLREAVCISVMGRDRIGRPLKVLSPEMQQIFGSFDGRVSFQRSPTRWIDTAHVRRTTDFVRSLN